MRTAHTIEQQKAANETGETPRRNSRGRVINPKSLAHLVAPWTSETAPRNGGRPRDTAADISRKAIEKNAEAIYKAISEKLLSGDAYAYSVHADRGFGKLKQGIIHQGDEDGGPIQSSIKVEFVTSNERDGEVSS